jgi:hypothetical protein
MAKYKPGSFSKNFAWHGTGLRRLHTATRNGFQVQLTPVDREQWRVNSAIGDSALELIPINFFLYNRVGKIEVDELVYQAVKHAHSIRFDRLGLFAFHLNRVGTPPNGGPSRPAMWANEFVRNQLWQAGEWQRGQLEDAALDRFIDNSMDASKGVKIKSRNNYRHLFELCGYWPARLPVINAGADDWAEQGLFLAWDRLILEQGTQTATQLQDWVGQEELYKLMGEPQGKIDALAQTLAPQYLLAGALNRFTATSAPTIATLPPAPAAQPAAPAQPVASPAPPRRAPRQLPAQLSAELLDDAGSNASVTRKIVQSTTLQRDRSLATKARLAYKHECLFCGNRLEIGEGLYYSEAAHIKPLGSPHNGPDKAGNLIVLCPNHHLQFDYGVLRLTAEATGYVISSKIKGDPLNGKVVKTKHTLDDDCVRWHFDWFDEGSR